MTPFQRTIVETALTEPVYMANPHNPNPIPARYGADNDRLTTNNPASIHLRAVLDPISEAYGVDEGTSLGGMSAKGCSRWAFGHTSSWGPVAPDHLNYPADVNGLGHFWSSAFHLAEQIGSHYFSFARFLRVSDGSETVPAKDRFTIVGVTGMPAYFRPGRTEPVAEILLQNSGVNTLTVTAVSDSTQTCTTSETNLSYHLWALNGLDFACGDQLPGQAENPGGNPCFEGQRQPVCVVGETQFIPGQTLPLSNVPIYIPPQPDLTPGRYLLTWDVLASHESDPDPPNWSSRWQISPYLPQWPFHGRFITIGRQQYPEVQSPHSPSHQVDHWSNNPTVTLSWQPPDDTIGTTHYFYRWPGLSDWQETAHPVLNTILPDGETWMVELYSQAADGETNPISTYGPFKIDTHPPTSTLIPFTRPWVIHTTFPVQWMGIDSNPESALFYTVHAQREGDDWQPWLTETTTLSATFTGLADVTYRFRVQAQDEAGNLSDWRGVEAVSVQPNPYLVVEPAYLYHWHPFSQTTPLTARLQVQNEGGGLLTWTIMTQPDVTWLQVGQRQGQGEASIPLTITLPPVTGTQTMISLGYQTVLTLSGGQRRDTVLLVCLYTFGRFKGLNRSTYL